MSLIEILTAGVILVIFGTGILLNSRKVLSWVSTPYPDPPRSREPKTGSGVFLQL
jgi:hypothetical protein